MEKIFKRIPKGTADREKEKQAETNNAAPPPPTTDSQPKDSRPATDGPAPKFAWSIKSQDDSKTKNQPIVPKEIPDGLWIKCVHCKELLYSKELENNKKVCHKCGYHFRLGAWERLGLLLDEGSFVEINRRLVTSDPLEFTSLAEPPYHLKAVESRQKTGLNEAIITGTGTLENIAVAVAICDFSYQGGSMGSVFGEKLVRLVEEAMARRLPLFTVSASGGARMHEGMFSLMQMAKTTAALARLSEAGLPHISLLTDPCTGGVIASYASVADVMLAEPGALLGFAGPRVIEQITKQKLPPGFQTAEFLLDHGMIDQVVPRKELRATLLNLLSFYQLAVSRSAAINPTFLISELEREVSYAG